MKGFLSPAKADPVIEGDIIPGLHSLHSLTQACINRRSAARRSPMLKSCCLFYSDETYV